MTATIYVERAIADHPRTRRILARFPRARRISCERYGEVFNPTSQNFRLQKQRPALILARKHRRHVLETPAGYGIGARHNFYFSHMMNCVYDCRYCFLQGMYRSAHQVLFVNYEDFAESIAETAQTHAGAETHFFSGYDCDSLAYEPVTGFSEYFLPLFERMDHAVLELRTKSVQIRHLLSRRGIGNCIVAFTLSPDSVARRWEHGAPSLDKRLAALQQLQQRGWRVGLRFDPIIHQHDFDDVYRTFFGRVFARLDANAVHSVTLGSFRLPTPYFRTVTRLYPEEPLFAATCHEHNGIRRYDSALEQQMLEFCTGEILRHVPAERLFTCRDS